MLDLGPSRKGSRRLRGPAVPGNAPSTVSGQPGRAGYRSEFDTIRRLAGEGQLDRAADLCAGVLAQGGPNAEAYLLQATIALEKMEPGRALEALRHAVRLDPDLAMAHIMLGGILRQFGCDREAGECVARALEALRKHDPSAVLPDSGGMTVAELEATVLSLVRAERTS